MSRSIPRLLLTPTLALLLAMATAPFGGQPRAADMWTDYNGDGLPDPRSPFSVEPGRSVSVDVWLDADGFRWTNFVVYVEWDPSAMTYQTADYLISGSGTTFPINRYSQTNAVGLGGFGYDSSSGPDRVARVELRYDGDGVACVSPITDSNNTYYSFLGAAPVEYALFADGPGRSCFESRESQEPTSWGGVKATFR